MSILWPLIISVTCNGTNICEFSNKDIPIEIKITNQSQKPVGFPVEFKQKTGPTMLLIDSKNKLPLRTNLADHKLKDQFTTIEPGQSVSLRWVIFANEVSSFSTEKTIKAEIGIHTNIRIDNETSKFSGTDTLTINKKAP